MNRRKGGRGRVDSCLMPFHTILNSSLSSGTSGPFILSPNSTISNRASVEADAWSHYRVKNFKFRLHPVNTVVNFQGVGFCGGIQDTPPSTLAQVGELIPSTILGGDTTIPTEWVSVPKVDLAGPLPWYKTVVGAADAAEEAPGAIFVVGTTTDTYSLEMRGVFEFKTSVAAANTPAALAAVRLLHQEKVTAARLRERTSLLRLLAPAGEKSTQ